MPTVHWAERAHGVRPEAALRIGIGFGESDGEVIADAEESGWAALTGPDRCPVARAPPVRWRGVFVCLSQNEFRSRIGPFCNVPEFLIS